MLTLSLIIPVYNEDHHIRACLDAVAAQTQIPDEIIVVDNNCTDRTVAIAREYSFVRIIKEPRQGRAYARSAGFNAAKGDIIGRIDADSRIDPNWVEEVKRSFNGNKELAGMSGLGRGWLFPAVNKVKFTFASRVYFWFAHAGFNTITMWGANMAIRRSAWERVREKTSNDERVHEDQDLSLWIAAEGGEISQNNKMLITTNGQGYRYLPKLFLYIRMYENTKKLHQKNGNFANERMQKLGFWTTLPGRLFAIVPVLYLIVVSVALFPVDFLINRLWPNSWWLD